MAKEYIEREVISEGIRKYYYKNPPNSSYQEGFDNGLDQAQRVILDAPAAADVATVVHGPWIHYPDCGVTRCSHCGWSIEECWESKRCPECGAKMDGAE